MVWTTRPSLKAEFPLVYKTCKVYHSISAKAFRILPKPGESLYDRCISYRTMGMPAAWADVLVPYMREH